MNDSSHYELYEWYIRNTWEILLNAYDILLFRSARLFTVGCPKDRLLCEDVSYLSPPRGGRGKPHFPNGIPFGMETTKNWSASSPKTVQMMPMIVFPGCCELLHRHLTDHLPRELTVGDPSPLWTTTHERSWNTSMFPVALLIQERDRSHWFKNTMVFKKPDVCYRHTSLHLFVVNVLVIPPAFKDRTWDVHVDICNLESSDSVRKLFVLGHWI